MQAMTPGKVILIGATSTLGFYALWRILSNAQAVAPTSGPLPIPDTLENREWLARLLMTEQSFPGKPINTTNAQEWAGIAWVAINRAKSTTGRVQDVAARGWFSASRGIPPRLTSPSLLTDGHGPDAVRFVAEIFAGNIPNGIGERITFAHAGGLPSCDTPTAQGHEDWICSDLGPPDGERLTPPWLVSKAQGGAARYEPTRRGAAIFA